MVVIQNLHATFFTLPLSKRGAGRVLDVVTSVLMTGSSLGLPHASQQPYSYALFLNLVVSSSPGGDDFLL